MRFCFLKWVVSLTTKNTIEFCIKIIIRKDKSKIHLKEWLLKILNVKYEIFILWYLAKPKLQFFAHIYSLDYLFTIE